MSRKREACGVLHSRESDVCRSAQRCRVRPDESQNCSVQKNIGKYTKMQYYWCCLKVAQKKGLQFCQTRSNAIILYNTLPAICIEKSGIHEVGEKTCTTKCISLPDYRQEPYSSRICIMDVRLLPNLEARTSVDHQSKESGEIRGEEFEETRSGNIDFQKTRSTTLNRSTG